eukprot:CAMPEP_0181207548 /NCGR_PEP_ID=MMETSP1096-20121128/21643_1 /TAXON_ID=156174 ORGANISM="Chrysochromulina ericina, Strain CCMP281" /NCGR_SAMPLE_ID=MMETSP1096 /ASSEMBLY_ACC=CAM_ASM_000453 /LENGTH=76 /DNA_ID=CAMNT_0023298553 /DNA_START=381 /DNA_END=611 /DNA_ORIENTATION=-
MCSAGTWDQGRCVLCVGGGSYVPSASTHGDSKVRAPIDSPQPQRLHGWLGWADGAVRGAEACRREVARADQVAESV